MNALVLIPDVVNEHIAHYRATSALGRVVPAVRLADGSLLSIQASVGHYCSPRDNYGPYTTVEVMIMEGPLTLNREPSEDDIWGFFPVLDLNVAIMEAGGIDAVVM